MTANDDNFLTLGIVSEKHTQLADPQRLKAAELIFSAASEFYGLIPLSFQQTLEIISSLIGARGGELENTYGLYCENNLVGVCTSLCASKVVSAQIRSSASILRCLDTDGAQRFSKCVRGFGKKAEEIRPDSIYLGRLAVASEARGKGFGTILMRMMMNLNPSSNYSLHVHRDNSVIIKLHSNLGFSFQSNSDFEFRTMVLDR